MKRFVKVCMGSAALAMVMTGAPMAAAAGASANAAPAGVQHGHLGKGRAVNFMAVSHTAKTPHPALAPPALYLNPGAAAAQRASAVSSGGRRSGLTPLAASRAMEAAGPGQTWTGFPTLSLGDQIGLLGSDQSVQPPDTQLAAGPSTLLEATNVTLSAWSKTGQLFAAADLNTFFNVPSGQSFTDPRLLYDTQSGRWFLSGWSFDATFTNTQTYLAVSDTSDPTGGWIVYVIQGSNTGNLTDQPNLGVCDDKVVVAWNLYGSGGSVLQGAWVDVLDKAALMANTSGPLVTSLFSPKEFSLVPAQSLSSTTTCYVAVNNADPAGLGNATSPSLGVYAITGTNAANDVSFGTESELPIAATSVPPFPRQPLGTTNDTVIDDRLLSAVWKNGTLWTSGTDACTPANDTTTRDCLRLEEVSTSNTPTVSLDTDLSQSGVDVYYPAVTLASTGDLSVSYSASSPSLNPGAYAVFSPAASIGTFTAPVTVAAGAASYNGGANARWGDYSSAAPDPVAAGAVWVAGEYAPSDAAQGDWGTAAALVSLSAAPAPAVAIGAEGTDGQLWVQTPQLGAGWHPLGGVIAGPPAVVAAATAFSGTPAQPLFIGTGTDKHLWVRSATAGWQPIGAALCIGSPGAVAYSGTLTVACRGTDNALWYNSVSWSGTGLPVFPVAGWKSLGGVLSAAPAVAPVGGTLTFFVRGTNGRIFTRTATSGYAATPWTCIGAPAAGVETASQDTFFACQGTDRALWVSVNGGSLQNGAIGGWAPAGSLGGTLIGGPAVAAGSLVTDLLVEGTNKAVFEISSVAGWTSLGGVVVGGVSAAALN